MCYIQQQRNQEGRHRQERRHLRRLHGPGPNSPAASQAPDANHGPEAKAAEAASRDGVQGRDSPIYGMFSESSCVATSQ
jgi:hypothetical protein